MKSLFLLPTFLFFTLIVFAQNIKLEKCQFSPHISIKFMLEHPSDTNLKYLAITTPKGNFIAETRACDMTSTIRKEDIEGIKNEMIDRNNIRKIIKTRDYTFVGTIHEKGLEIYDRQGKLISKNNKIGKIAQKINSFTNQIYDLYFETHIESGKNAIWVATDNGLFKIYFHQKKYERYFEGKIIKNVSAYHTSVWAIVQEGEENHFYKRTQTNLSKEATWQKSDLYGLNINHVVAMDFDDFGKLWLITQNQVLVYNSLLKRLESQIDINHPSCMLIDKHNDIWIGTQASGLFYVKNTHFDNVDIDIEKMYLIQKKEKIKLLCRVNRAFTRKEIENLVFEFLGKNGSEKVVYCGHEAKAQTPSILKLLLCYPREKDEKGRKKKLRKFNTGNSTIIIKKSETENIILDQKGDKLKLFSN